MSKAKAKKVPKAKRDASDKRGIPGGWTPITDKPGKTKGPAPPKVIKVSHPVETDSFKKNFQAMTDFAKKFAKTGGSVFQTRPMTQEEANARLKARSAKGTEGGAKAKEPKKDAPKKKVSKRKSKKEESDNGSSE